MDWIHWHLMLCHIPVIGVPVVMLFLGWGIVARSRQLRQVALAATVLVAVGTIPAFLTGSEAEERAQGLSWFSEERVESHEERAEATLVVTLVAGALAAATFAMSRRQHRFARASSTLVLATLLVSMGLAGWTAAAGGIIRHDEIRPSDPGSSVAYPEARRVHRR